jgi:hypothetical protein
MSTADKYRIRAAEFAAMAKSETIPALQTEYDKMAVSYIRLAELADRNALTDIVYETPPPDHKTADP